MGMRWRATHGAGLGGRRFATGCAGLLHYKESLSHLSSDVKGNRIVILDFLHTAETQLKIP